MTGTRSGDGADEAPPTRGASSIVPPAAVAKIVPKYLDACRKRLADIVAAMEALDFDTVRQNAHVLRGTGGAYGFDAITKIAMEIEATAISRDGMGLQAACERLRLFLAT